MSEGAKNPEQPSILHRTIPKRAMEIILVVLIILVLVFVLVPTCATQPGPAKTTQDLSNIRQAIISIYAYTIDNNNQLPTHVMLLEDYGLVREVLISPFDLEESLVFDQNAEPGWYQYGSYRFLSAEHININEVESPSEFILVYRTPRADSDFYLVGFLDGHAEVLTSDEFKLLMQWQGGLIQPSDEGPLEPRFEMLDSDG